MGSSTFWAAHSFVDEPNRESVFQPTTLLPIRFREDRNAGILVNGWVNGAGPFTFAIDTGAGASLITTKVVSVPSARVTIAASISRRSYTSPIASMRKRAALEYR